MQVGLGSGNTGVGQSITTAELRLVRAAQEFEAQMMKELLKPMMGRDALTGDESETDGGAGSAGALGDFAAEALGQAVSRRGGFGIADRILHDLSQSGHGPMNMKFTAGKLDFRDKND